MTKWSRIFGTVPDDDGVFKALADPTRRFLLDLLFARDGRTLTELESELEMSRFGVMKHLRVLEEAGLVVTHRSGREKLHFLNAVPIRLIHDRWIGKYTAHHASALAELKAELEAPAMAGTTPSTRTVQVYRVFIKATPEAIWDAITKPEWTARYGYRSPATYELYPGGTYQGHASEEMKAMGSPDVVVEGEVIEADPPRKLVQTWHPVWDAETASEPATRLTYEIEQMQGGVSKLTVIHDVTGATHAAAMVAGEVPGAGGGWSEVLSDLKTLLETGRPLYG